MFCNSGSSHTEAKFNYQIWLRPTPGVSLPLQGGDLALLCAQPGGGEGGRAGEVPAEDDGGGGEVRHGDLL